MGLSGTYINKIVDKIGKQQFIKVTYLQPMKVPKRNCVKAPNVTAIVEVDARVPLK